MASPASPAPPAAAPAGAPRSVPCIVCREPIQSGATLCVHCKSEQSWTRHVFRWTGVFVAALTLLPVWTGARALWVLAFPNHKTEVRSLAIECSAESLILAFTNSGDRPGIVSGFSLRTVVDGREAKEEVSLVPATDRRLVSPGETFTLPLLPQIEGVAVPLPLPTGAWKSCEHRVSTVVKGFDGETSLLTSSCPCAGARGPEPRP